MLTYHSRLFTTLTWPLFLAFVKTLLPRLGCRAWAACVEKGTTAETAQKHHFHVCFYWNDGHGVDLDSTDTFVFNDVHPRVDVRTASKTSFAAKVAAYHGLWYVAVMKLGTVASETNFEAWKDYTPLASWIDGLMSAKKLSVQQYLQLAREIGVGYAKRKRDAVEMERDEIEVSIREHIAAESQDLQRFPPRSFPEIDAFVNLFAETGRWRRPMLLLLAPTNLGKSMLAEHTLRRIADLLHLPGYIEVTVEGDDHLDFSEYVHNKHAGVLLDGVGDVLTLKRNREVLQGRAKPCKGALREHSSKLLSKITR